MALNKPLETVKEDFEAAAKGKRTLTPPRGPRVRKLSEVGSSYFKGLVFGKQGSGKTRLLIGLLLHGLKIFAIATDMGGEGFSTVELELKRIGREDLLENITVVVLSTYQEVETFVQNPAKIYPDIYKEGFDFLFWDGLSGFQQNSLADYIGEMTPARSENGKEVSDGRDSGLQFEQTDWGMVKTGTLRNVDKFLKLYNLETGEVWHKWITCLEDVKPVKTANGTVYQETREPMLQGASKKLIGPAFDLIINTRIKGDKDESKREFRYVLAGHDSLDGPKNRGLALPDDMPGDMFKLWEEIAKQKGLKRGAISAEFEQEKTNSVS